MSATETHITRIGTVLVPVGDQDDRLRLDFNLLDLTPLGRQEEWQDSPAGWPQTPPDAWWRKHDEYEVPAA